MSNEIIQSIITKSVARVACHGGRSQHVKQNKQPSSIGRYCYCDHAHHHQAVNRKIKL